MRIAFVSANRENLPDPVAPIGLIYVYAATPAAHTKTFIDLRWAKDPCARARQELTEFAPQLVGVGLRNIYNSDYGDYTDNIAYYRDLLTAIREVTPAPIVIGGGGFSVMPAALMAALAPDFGITGEGEAPFAALVAALDANQPVDDVPSLWRFVAGELRHNPPAAEFQILDDLVVPDRRLIHERLYRDCGIDSVQTKRGCPLHCTYCTYPTIEGRKIRQRNPRAVVDEMLAAKQAQPGIDHFFIVDSVFNLPPAHAKAVCREMIARSLDIPWTCYANPIGFDDELAELMAAAGCTGVEIGSDSGAPATLSALKKGFGIDAIRDIHRRCGDAGIKDCHTFILGAPGEALADVHESLDFCIDLDPFAAIMMIWVDDEDATRADSAELVARRQLREKVAAVLRERIVEFPRWIVPSLRVNFDPRLFRLMRIRGASGPLWQHIELVDGEATATRERLARIATAVGTPR